MKEIVGIVASNTISYIEAVFENWEKFNIVVPLRDENDSYRINAASVERTIVPSADSQNSWGYRKFVQPESDETALIAFTSGTEGNPKGVKISHNNLAEVVGRLNTTMDVKGHIKEYVGVPVFHSFGLGRVRAVSAVNGKFYIPPNGFDPKEISNMLKRDEINAISAVPSLWRVLLENKGLISGLGDKVFWIEIGSQYMSKREKEELKTLFPNANIVQHYGLTEASRTTLLEISKISGDELESVGKVFGNIEVKITDDRRIAIQGSNVASGYIIDGEEKPLVNDDGWFVTNDLGLILDGCIYYKGRADDIININGIKVSPEQIETKIFPFIYESERIAICRKKDKISGERVLVAVKRGGPDELGKIYKLILKALSEMEIFGASLIDIIEVDEIPRTASGKIQRRKLSKLYGETKPAELSEINPDAELVAPENNTEWELSNIYAKSLGLKSISTTADFFENGGDSIKAIEIITKINNLYQKDYYLDILFKNPAIKDMARLINTDTAENEYHLIKVREGVKAGPNLFLIHDGFGEVMLYKNVADLMNDDINVYLAPPLRQYGLVTTHFRIKDMVDFFTEHILAIQGEGIYNLGGLCDGGELSYEIACELQRRKKDVNLIALMEAALPGIQKGGVLKQRKDRFKGAVKGKNLADKVILIFGKMKNVISYEMKMKSENKEKDRMYNHLLESDNLENISDSFKSMSFPEIYNRAMQNHQVSLYEGNLSLFKASEGIGSDTPMKCKIEDKYLGWGQIHSGEIQVYDIPGGHTSMLQSPNAEHIAEIINKKIYS